MGKTRGIASSAPSRTTGIEPRRGQLKSLAGISHHHWAVEREEDMVLFRSFLWEQAPKELQPALNQFRRSDLTAEDRQREPLMSDNRRLSPALRELAAADEESNAYLDALLSLLGSTPDADRQIAALLTKAEAEVQGGKPLEIDVSMIEILLARATTDSYPEKLATAHDEANQLLRQAGIEPPDCPVLLLPPLISALASNCDQTPVEEAKLRSGRFYPQQPVILITDDRQVINRHLLLHELIHARQSQGAQEISLAPEAAAVYEALTERLALEIDPSYPIWPEEQRLITKIEALPLSAEALSQLSWQEPGALCRQLAEEAFPGASDPEGALEAALDLD